MLRDSGRRMEGRGARLSGTRDGDGRGGVAEVRETLNGIPSSRQGREGAIGSEEWRGGGGRRKRRIVCAANRGRADKPAQPNRATRDGGEISKTVQDCVYRRFAFINSTKLQLFAESLTVSQIEKRRRFSRVRTRRWAFPWSSREQRLISAPSHSAGGLYFIVLGTTRPNTKKKSKKEGIEERQKGFSESRLPPPSLPWVHIWDSTKTPRPAGVREPPSSHTNNVSLIGMAARHDARKLASPPSWLEM
ncbi:hypothetical protein DFH09DRAFT_1283529 [Mycena vulgaris]|nr:hypothetical protein DFH09DRAFT_1283529 [Mycena vulgaris]